MATMQARHNREVGQNITILGWVYIVANALLLVAGALVFLLLFGFGYASCAWEPFIIWSGLGVFLGVLIILLALLGILAGLGLIRRCAWGRTLAIVVALPGLVCFPIGTLIGIFALIVLLRDGLDGSCCPPKKDPCDRPKDPCDQPKDPCDRPKSDPRDWPSRDPRDWPKAPYERPSRDPRDWPEPPYERPRRDPRD